MAADRNIQLFAEPDDLPVQLAQPLVVLHRALAHEERVVADRLHLEVIIEPRDFLQISGFALARQHRAEQLARFARASDDQPLAVFLDQAARNARRAVEIVSDDASLTSR